MSVIPLLYHSRHYIRSTFTTTSTAIATSTSTSTTPAWDGMKYKKLPTSYHITTQTQDSKIIHASRQISVVQYNILAGNLAKEEHFPYVPTQLLAWKERKQRLVDIMTRVSDDDATIICCEELNSYWTFFQPELLQHGYRSVYLKRPNTHVSHWSGLDKYDGCMIAWRSSTWDLLEVESVYYSDEHDRIAVMVLLKWKQEWEEDVSRHYSPYVIVACTHLYWNSQRLDVQLTELHHLQYALHRFRCQQQLLLNETRTIPTIVCGDFNNGPNSEIYQHMTCQDQDLLRSYTQRPPTVTRVLKQAAADATPDHTKEALQTQTQTHDELLKSQTSTSANLSTDTPTATATSTTTDDTSASTSTTTSTSASSPLIPSRPTLADKAQLELNTPEPHATTPRYVFRSAYAQYGCLTSTPPASSSTLTSPTQFFEPAFTSITPRRCWTIDYIFYNQDAIRPTHLLVMPEKTQLQQENREYRCANGLPSLPSDPTAAGAGVDLAAAIPNHIHPSDHFPIAARFQLVPQAILTEPSP